MSQVSYSKFRRRMAKYMDDVWQNGALLRVTRQKAGTVVMLSEADYEGLLETLHLLRNPTNAKRLLRSIEGADAGRMAERALIEEPDAPWQVK